MSLTKKEVITNIAESTGQTKLAVEQVLDGFVGLITTQLSNNHDLSYPALGKFSVADRAARAGRNPATGEEMQIPAKSVPKFSAAKQLKDAVAN